MIGIKRKIDMSIAISELRPGAPWALRNDDFDTLEWYDESFSKPTLEEIKNKIEELEKDEPLRALREIRDFYLQKSDWTQAQDVRSIRGPEWCNQWDTYRQELRDMTKKYPDVYFDEMDLLRGFEWPEKPES